MNWPENMSIKFITSEIHLILVLTGAHPPARRLTLYETGASMWAVITFLPPQLLNENVRLIPTIHSGKSHSMLLVTVTTLSLLDDRFKARK